MPLDPKNLTPGKRYVIHITGCFGPAVAECTGEKDKYGWCKLRVLNVGFMDGVVLKEGDYVLREEYDSESHGPIAGQ